MTNTDKNIIQIANNLLESNRKVTDRGFLTNYHIGILRRVAKNLNLDSIHVFWYSYRRDNIKEFHVFGERNLWSNIDISSLNKDIVFSGDFSFFKIRSLYHNGHFINYGYIGVYKRDITPNEISQMNLISLIFGIFLSETIIRYQNENTEKYLPAAFERISMEQQPGTAIVVVLKALLRITCFVKTWYFSIDDIKWIGEYSRHNDNGQNYYILHGHAENIAVVSNEFNSRFMNLDNYLQIDLIGLPDQLQKILHYKYIKDKNKYVCLLYPIKYEGELIGAWVAITSKQKAALNNGESFLRSTYPLMRDNYKYIYQRSSKKLIIDPMFVDRDTRINEKEVFVIMPFTEEWSGVVWSHMITPAVESMGLTPFRADNLYGEKIMEDIWKGILHSSIVIADITGRNPNVFYELGIAHTLGKKVILLTQNVEDIPFDLRHLRHIIYKTDIVGADKFKPELINFINEQLNSSAN